MSLSEQQLVDCSHDCSNEGDPPFPVCNSGCQGGWPWAAYLTLMNSGGIMSETDYAYKVRPRTRFLRSQASERLTRGGTMWILVRGVCWVGCGRHVLV